MTIKERKSFLRPDYQTRLVGYERDKQNLVRTMAHLPADEFAEKLKELQEKWKI
jgi:hypothetical protein